MRRVLTLATIVAAGWLAVSCTSLSAERADDWTALEQQFTGVPMEARRLTGPLFWLDGDEGAERLRMYLEKVAEGHNGTFCAESRPHQDWLGEGWYRDLATCLDAARAHDLTMWIFDERWWPSGEVAGRVPRKYASKYMDVKAIDVQGQEAVSHQVPADHLIAVLAGRRTEQGIVGDSLLDLADRVRDGTLRWQAPEGRWQVLVFTWRYMPKRRRGYLVDGASREAVDWYLETVYQPHYDHFKEAFGKTIKGYFYDEPQTRGDWGTEVLPLLKERGIDWKRALVAWKVGLADADEQTAARYQYQDAFAEAWGRTLYGGITEWCHAHGVESIGHFLEHNWEYLRPDLCAGNMVQLQKYSDMGGVDLVVRQFYPGQRKMGLWQMAKLGSSISHAYDKPGDLAMCEIFGAYGQDITYLQMKWLLDQMQVRGTNFMITHSFNPNSPYDRDCPPYFYNGGFEPRWPLYRVWADYNNRLSLLLTGGRHVCPIALLYLGNSRHVGEAVTPEQMTTAIQDAFLDCDWLPYDVFEEDADLQDRRVRLHDEAYRVLVVPPVEVIPYNTLAKARRFFEAGGIVVGYGFLPTKSATLGKTSEDIATLRRAVWGEAPTPGTGLCKRSGAGGRSYFLPKTPTPEQLRRTLVEDGGLEPALEVIQGETGGRVHVLHRVKGGRDVFLVCNQHHEGQARRLRFRARAAGVPQRWDAMRNEITAVPHERNGNGACEFDLVLEANESVLLVFAAEPRPLPPRFEAQQEVRPAIAPERVPVTEQPPSAPPTETETPAPRTAFGGCPWVWHPGEKATTAAPPEARCFRTEIDLAGRKVKRAVFTLTADNAFALYVNGEEVGSGSEWSRPYRVDMTKALRPGANALAVRAVNTSDEPNPAGLIGRYVVEFEQGEPLTGGIDASWRTAKQAPDGWRKPGFDDAAWKRAEKVADVGGGPWSSPRRGRRRLTTSPIQADLYRGRFTLPPDVDLVNVRAVLRMAGVPRGAAAVTVNGAPAGGVIGGPYRLDVTEHLEAGENTVEVAPLAPKTVRLLFYPAGPSSAGGAGGR